MAQVIDFELPEPERGPIEMICDCGANKWFCLLDPDTHNPIVFECCKCGNTYEQSYGDT